MLAVTVEITWTAVGVMCSIIAALIGGLFFIWDVSRRQRYLAKRQKKLIKASIRQGRLMTKLGITMDALRTDQKRIMQAMPVPLEPTGNDASGALDAIPEDLSVDGLFTEEDLDDEDD